MSAPPTGLLELRCPVPIGPHAPGRTCNRLLAYVAHDAVLQVLCKHCGHVIERARDGRISARGPRRPTRPAGSTAPAAAAVGP
jgi:phage FluMu protein Com